MPSHFKRQLWTSFSIIFGSIAIVVVALYYFAGDIDARAGKIIADRSLINQQSNSLDVIAGFKEQAPQAENYKAAMDQLLPTQDGLIDFSQWISGVAAKHQVTANVVFGGDVSPPGAGMPGEANFSIVTIGSLNDIAAFLEDAETKTPGFFLQINSFNLTYANPNYTLNGQGSLFFRP